MTGVSTLGQALRQIDNISAQQKLFSQLGKDKANDEQQSIPEFFMKISDIENRFMIKILKKIT